MHRSQTVALLWLISAVLFISLYQMGLRSSAHSYPSASDSVIPIKDRRTALYEKMGSDLDEKGPTFLKQGHTSQSLSISDIFDVKDGYVVPRLKAADPPVRANVLYLSTEFSHQISEALKPILDPYFDKLIWFQNSSVYHFSMFHASHHISPVPATQDEIEVEAAAVRSVAEGLCPLKIVLDRVILTSTGVLLGCWQVISGSDPITIRAKLRSALPRAPEKQLYDAAILHTSFARLLGEPNSSSKELSKTSDQIHFFRELVDRINNELKGFEAVVSELWYVEEFDVLALALNGRMKAVVSELWYVEEFDVLALALNGRMKVRKFQLGCSRH